MRLEDKDKMEAEKICEEVARFFHEYHYAPSMRDLCKMLNIKSTASISAKLNKAQSLGYLRYTKSEPRTIVLTGYEYLLKKKEN